MLSYSLSSTFSYLKSFPSSITIAQNLPHSIFTLTINIQIAFPHVFFPILNQQHFLMIVNEKNSKSIIIPWNVTPIRLPFPLHILTIRPPIKMAIKIPVNERTRPQGIIRFGLIPHPFPIKDVTLPKQTTSTPITCLNQPFFTLCQSIITTAWRISRVPMFLPWHSNILQRTTIFMFLMAIMAIMQACIFMIPSEIPQKGLLIQTLTRHVQFRPTQRTDGTIGITGREGKTPRKRRIGIGALEKHLNLGNSEWSVVEEENGKKNKRNSNA